MLNLVVQSKVKVTDIKRKVKIRNIKINIIKVVIKQKKKKGNNKSILEEVQ